MSKLRFLGFLPVILIVLNQGCGPQASHRENMKSTDTSESQAKLEELSPAEGTFVGTMHLAESGQSFTFDLQLKRVIENVHPNLSSDPTDTIGVPRISGNLRFPALATGARIYELLDPMGIGKTMLVDFGDFNPKTLQLILPYSIPGYTQGGFFGELSGTLSQGRFSGTWFSKPFGTVGTFESVRKSSDTGASTK